MSLQDTRPPNRLGRFIQNIRNRFTTRPDIPLTTRLSKTKKTMEKERCLICDTKATVANATRPCYSCQTPWCKDCIRNAFLIAMKTPADMPPKCCRVILPHVGLDYLSAEEQKKYKIAFDEYRTEVKDRIYCPNTDCGVHISQHAVKTQGADAEGKQSMDGNGKKRDSGIENEDASKNPIISCPECSTSVCLSCKKRSHVGSPCAIEDDETVAQIRKWGYKRCPRCGYGIRRMWGCSHMECVCGAHFCWHCEKNYTVCEELGGCAEDDDDYGSDREIDEDEVIADDVVMTDVIDRDGEEASEAVDSKKVEEAEPGPSTVVEKPDSQPKDDEIKPPEEITKDDTDIAGVERLPTPANRNLDRGTHQFWEEQGLYFGDEPGDVEDDVWGCTHSFVVRDKAYESHRERFGNGLVGKEVYWCWDCWEKIDRAEGFKECWVCSMVRCNGCDQLFSGKKEDIKEDMTGGEESTEIGDVAEAPSLPVAP